MPINWIRHQTWVRFIFFYTRNLYNKRLNRFLSTKSPFWICVLVLWIRKGNCVVKKLLWNVRIKAFWYTNNINMIYWIILSYSLNLSIMINLYNFTIYIHLDLSLYLSIWLCIHPSLHLYIYVSVHLLSYLLMYLHLLIYIFMYLSISWVIY